MDAKKKRRILTIAAIAVLLIALAGWTVWGNGALELNTYIIASEKLPANFHGFRIAQVSDLHNTELGENNKNLLAMLRSARPDIIVITGDLIDSRNTDVGIALSFTEEAMKIAPCYYVTGNHEARVSQYNTLREGLMELGVITLENAWVEIQQGGEKVTLMGVDDPSFQTDYLFGDEEAVMTQTLNNLTWDKDSYTILLSHRPELFDVYEYMGVDLVFSGHAHGGQFRLPFVGGLVAPNQGFFPEYDSCLYTKNNTAMLVSRGIGNSIIPIRFNNRPEVILAELKSR